MGDLYRIETYLLIANMLLKMAQELSDEHHEWWLDVSEARHLIDRAQERLRTMA